MISPAARASQSSWPLLVAAVLVPAFAFAPAFTPAVSAQNTLPAPASSPSASRATRLVSEAFDVANSNGVARANAVRGAAALLPRLPSTDREALYGRWLKLAMSPGVSRSVRLGALDSFFDVAARADLAFARQKAMSLPDPAGRAGAFIQLSRASYPQDFIAANADSQRALRAARQEPSYTVKAKVLTYAAVYIAALNPATRRAAVYEASNAVKLLAPSRTRDSLLAEIVGAASKFDLVLARNIVGGIANEKLRGLANARVNLAEVSQTTLTVSTQDRIKALAAAAAPYDPRTIPILLDLPPQGDVLKVISDALPQISPKAVPSVDISLLERVWDYSARLEPSVYRDQLQSRLARLMVLQDPARGRQWGKRLTWKGGRVQVGSFLNAVLSERVKATATPTAKASLFNLTNVSDKSVESALLQARSLSPQARVEALLLIAGQLVG